MCVEWPKTDRHWLKAIEIIPEVIRSLDNKVMEQDKWPLLIRTLPAYFSDLFHSLGTAFLLNTSRKKVRLQPWAGLQNIWIQHQALLQISNMTLGTPINLLHLSSLAVKRKESYYYFPLAHSLVFSMEPLSIFGEFPGITTSINLAEAMQVKCCAKSQAWRGQRQHLEDYLLPVLPVAESLLQPGIGSPGCLLPSRWHSAHRR